MIKKIKIIILPALLIVVIGGVVYLFHKHTFYSKSENAIAKEDGKQEKEEKEIKKVVETVKELPSLSSSLDAYLLKHKLDDKVFIYVSGLTREDTYMRHIDTNVFAASIYKLPLAMLYYEKINAGECKLSDVLVYERYHYESGGPIGDSFKLGTNIRLETLLQYMIVHSDNTAAHMLYENLGGWVKFKKLITKYSATKIMKPSYDNVMNARYMNNVMRYLYTNRASFAKLIQDMKEPTAFNYLSDYVTIDIAQKYGSYDMATNSVGIVYASKPYSIVIFTSLEEAIGRKHISKINEVCNEYFNQ